MQALVVDDSRAMRSILARLMTGLGFEVAQAGDGAEALAPVRGLRHLEADLAQDAAEDHPHRA